MRRLMVLWTRAGSVPVASARSSRDRRSCRTRRCALSLRWSTVASSAVGSLAWAWAFEAAASSSAAATACRTILQSIGRGTLHGAVEAQLLQVLERVLRLHERALRMVQPIVKPGQQKTQRAAAGEDRQGLDLGRRRRPGRAVAADQRPRLGRVQAAVPLEAPRVEANPEVVPKGVVAGEIEVDNPRQLVVDA